MKGFFEDIPVELEQAAMVDGHSRFKVFFKIAVPLARAGIAVAGLFAFIFAWNELMFASIFGRYNVQTLPLALQDYIGSTGVPNSEARGGGGVPFPYRRFVSASLTSYQVMRYIVRRYHLGVIPC